MAINIPEGLTLDHFSRINTRLQAMLADVRNVAGLENAAALVIMRLNRSNKADPAPVHVCWAENPAMEQRRISTTQLLFPGLDRFGDPRPSDLYLLTVSKAKLADPFVEHVRNSPASIANPLIALPGAPNGRRKITSKLNLQYQLNIGIKADGKCVGSLSVALDRIPDGQGKTGLKNVMRDWAQNQLPAFLQPEYQLGGS